jgi:hypothetical protein
LLLPFGEMENRLLAALPDSARSALIGRAQRIALAQKAVLVERGALMSELYFPLSGLLSMVVRVTESAAVEVAAVGNEGFVGAPAFLGAERSATEVVVQIPGEALQVPVDAVSAQAGRLLERYIAALMTQMSQSTACNYLHAGIPRADARGAPSDGQRGGGRPAGSRHHRISPRPHPHPRPRASRAGGLRVLRDRTRRARPRLRRLIRSAH